VPKNPGLFFKNIAKTFFFTPFLFLGGVEGSKKKKKK
jgi:hypothetical protein